MNKKFNKLLKTEKKMASNKSSLIGFALAGMAAGAAAWYLFGTKEGRKSLNKAMDGIHEFSNTIKEKASEGMECASEFADKAKKKAKKKFEEGRNKFSDATDEITEKGSRLKSDMEDLGRKAANHGEDLVDEARNKVKG